MRELTKSQVAALREQYPAGSRIRLIQMNDPYHPVPPGAEGTLAAIDDLGTFHVSWDNGRGLGLVPGEDQFEVTPLETLKLYMPLNAVTYEEAEWADLDQGGIQLDGRDLLSHKEAINQALRDNDLPAEKTRGLMHWHDEKDGVNRKPPTHKEVMVSCRTAWQIAMLSCFFFLVQWSACPRPASVPRRSSK